MNDCPNCEYHKNRAARWRAEAYAQAGHDIIERPWVGLTYEEQSFVYDSLHSSLNRDKPFWVAFADAIEAKLKEKNVGAL